MFEDFKAYLNKNGNKFTEGHVDPFTFHSFLYRFMVYFRIIVEDKNPIKRYLNQNTVIYIAGISGALLMATTFAHGVEIFNIPLMTESGTYFICLCYMILIMSCTTINLPAFHTFIQAMKDDFNYVCTDGERYRERYFKNQLFTWKICVIANIYTAFIAAGMLTFSISSLLLYFVIHKPGDGSSRPLLFPVWLPNIDIGKTPYYEITFVFVNYATLCYAYTYTFMLQTQIMWIRHIATKVDIIIWSIEDLLEDIHPTTDPEEIKHFSDLIRERMSKIVKHHLQMLSVMEAYSMVYNKLLMFEQKFFGPIICLTAYCTAENLDEGKVQPILPLLCVATVMSYFIPNYCCTYLASKVTSICTACWNTQFWNAGRVIRPYMVLIMQRSTRPIPLGVPGFQEVSLETYSKNITSAYSFFNMLRQL